MTAPPTAHADDDVRPVVLAVVKSRATRAALAGKGLTPLMVTAVTAEFLRAGNPDGTCIQVGIAVVAEALGVSHMSVSRVRQWLMSQGIGHFESGARQGAKASWWHVSLATPDDCHWCAKRRPSPEHHVQEVSPEHHVQESLLNTTPEHHSRTPLLNTTPEHQVFMTNKTNKTNTSVSQKRARPVPPAPETPDLTDQTHHPPPEPDVDAWLRELSTIARVTLQPNPTSRAAARHAINAGHSPPDAWDALLDTGLHPGKSRGGAILGALAQLGPTAKVLQLHREPWRAHLRDPTSPCDQHPPAIAAGLTRNQCRACREAAQEAT